jgi:hypothetical protein
MESIKKKTLLKAKVLEQTLSYARTESGVGGGAGGDDNESVATAIVNLALKSGEYFHTTDGDGYATIEIKGHKETWSIRNRVFRGWLTKLYYDDTASAPSSEALGAASNVLEAKARFDGLEIPVFLRVGKHGKKIYLDICDANWRAIEIDADGWRVVDNPPIKFRRNSGMLPLPVPQ